MKLINSPETEILIVSLKEFVKLQIGKNEVTLTPLSNKLSSQLLGHLASNGFQLK